MAAARFDGWKGKLGRELITSLVACAVTAPLVAWVFGRVSLRPRGDRIHNPDGSLRFVLALPWALA